MSHNWVGGGQQGRNSSLNHTSQPNQSHMQRSEAAGSGLFCRVTVRCWLSIPAFSMEMSGPVIPVLVFAANPVPYN